MGPLLFGLFCSFLLVVSLYSFLRWRDLKENWDSVIEGYEHKQNELDDRQTILDEKIKKLEKYKDIPDIIEKSRKINEEVESRIGQANKKAEQIINLARIEARKVHLGEIEDAESYLNDIKASIEKIDQDAKSKSEIIKQEAKSESKKIIEAAKEKATLIVEETDKQLRNTITYCVEMRKNAEKKVELMNYKSYTAMNQYEFYEKAAQAMKNVIEGYKDNYMNIMSSQLDELSDEFGYVDAGMNLKTARNRTKHLMSMRLAAISDYAEV